MDLHPLVAMELRKSLTIQGKLTLFKFNNIKIQYLLIMHDLTFHLY